MLRIRDILVRPDPRLWLMYLDPDISSMTFKTPQKKSQNSMNQLMLEESGSAYD